MVVATITERGILSKNNNIVLENNVNNKAYNLSSGTATAATSTSITLEEGADNAYNNKVIEIVYGTGKNQARVITSLTSLVANVSPAWDIIPDNTSEYIIHTHSGICQEQSHKVLDCYIKLSASASSIDEFYTGSFIKILHGNGRSQLSEIIEYEGATKLACLEPELQTPVLENSIYAIYGEGGLSPGGNTSTTIILDGNQSSTVGQYHYIEIISGTGQGQVRMISSISVNTITVSTAWDTTPDATSRYVIYGGWAPEEYENIVKHAIITVAADINTHHGERTIIDLESSMSVNGSYELRNITELSSIVPSNAHAMTVITQFFRLKIVSMGTALNGQIQTILNSYKSGKLTALIEDTIHPNSDCELTRSVIVGKTSSDIYRNISSDYSGNLCINIRNPLDGFGALMVTQPRQFSEVMFINNFVNPTILKTELLYTGAITAANNICSVSSGTNANGVATFYTLRRLRYTPGLAVTVRFTSIFSDPIENAKQLIGLGDSCDGLFVGYNGLKFGILLRRGGHNEIHRLTITTTSTADDTITITLNGQTTAGISILSTDNTQNIARKIAASTSIFSALGGGWDVYEEGATVLFISRTAEPLSGSYSYNIGTSDSAGTFTQICAGITPSETWTYQNNWNKDRAFGYQNLPTINFQKGNIWELGIQWLGFGNLLIKLENPRTGYFQDVHHINYANSSTLTSTQNPHLPLCVHVSKSSAAATDIFVKTASMGIFVMGDYNKSLGTRLGISAVYDTANGALNAGTYYNLLCIRNMATFNNIKNVSEILALNITACLQAGVDITKGGVFTFFASFSLTNTNTLTWTKRSAATSTVEYCTDVVPIIGGSELMTRVCGPNFEFGNTVLDMEMSIIPGVAISLAFKPFSNLLTTPATSTATIAVGVSWIQR